MFLFMFYLVFQSGQSNDLAVYFEGILSLDHL